MDVVFIARSQHQRKDTNTICLYYKIVLVSDLVRAIEVGIGNNINNNNS